MCKLIPKTFESQVYECMYVCMYVCITLTRLIGTYILSLLNIDDINYANKTLSLFMYVCMYVG